MTPRVIRIDYPDSVWGSDLVLFHVPNTVSDYDLRDEIAFRREDFNSADFDSLEDMTDAILASVADHFGGTWRYLPLAGIVSITED